MTAKCYLYAQEPLWHKDILRRRFTMSAQEASWIDEKKSITQRLRKQYGAEVSVEVLSSYWQCPFISESRLLACHINQYALVREVLLSAGQKALVLARTVIPLATVKNTHFNLIRLGTRPLGELIFADPNLTRRRVEICHMYKTAWKKQIFQKVAIENDLWGRRTVYIMHRNPLLVTEFFLAE